MNVLSIAKYLVEKHKILEPLKIQKLTYFIYIEYLKHNNKKLFKENFEAWIYGPVIRKIHNHINERGLDFSNEIIFEINKNNGYILSESKIENPSEKVQRVIDKVVKKFNNKSASYLVTLSHNTKPWIKARNGLDITESSNNLISFLEIEKYAKNEWNI